MAVSAGDLVIWDLPRKKINKNLSILFHPFNYLDLVGQLAETEPKIYFRPWRAWNGRWICEHSGSVSLGGGGFGWNSREGWWRSSRAPGADRWWNLLQGKKMRETEKEMPRMPQRNPAGEGKYLVDGLEPDPLNYRIQNKFRNRTHLLIRTQT